jgi:hypothetical protein
MLMMLHSTFPLMLSLHLALRTTQMIKYLQLLKALIFLNQARNERRTLMMSMWWYLKILDFVVDYDEEDMACLYWRNVCFMLIRFHSHSVFTLVSNKTNTKNITLPHNSQKQI